MIFGALLDGRNHSKTRYARGIAYNPRSDAWRMLPSSRLSPQASTIAWTGAEIVAWDYELQAAAYASTRDRWRALPPLPLGASECYPESIRVGAVVFAWYCG